MTTGRINQVTALHSGPVAEATQSRATLCRSNGVFGVLVSDACTPAQPSCTWGEAMVS